MNERAELRHTLAHHLPFITSFPGPQEHNQNYSLKWPHCGEYVTLSHSHITPSLLYFNIHTFNLSWFTIQLLTPGL